jgi:hypothetical protein
MKVFKIGDLTIYLPYKLKVMHFGTPKVMNMGQGSSKYWVGIKTVLNYSDPKKVCPILRSLSNMFQEFEFYGETIDILEEIYSESWMACGYITKARKTFIEIISKEDNSVIRINLDKPQCNEVWINEVLLKYHFDTKFLIEKGLAIDINTL